MGKLLILSTNLAFAETSSPVDGEKAFSNCAGCHQVGKDATNAFGPVLTGVIGRKGKYPGYNYSPGLAAAKDKGLVWTEELLSEWLAGPSQFLKKFLNDPNATSNMPVSFDDVQMRKNVIAYLQDTKTEKVVMEMSHGSASHGPQQAETTSKPDEIDKLPHVKQKLVAPPLLPEHTQKAEGGPKVVEVELTVTEKEWLIDGKGTTIAALTYNGSIPAPIIVVHENDYVLLTLINPSTNSLEHNIDLHAATGALGGAALTTVTPGNKAVLRFKADRSGVFLYHCAPEGVMTPYHVTHGMTGAIMVLPKDGLKDDKGRSIAYDKAYFIGETEFYVPKDEKGNYKSYSKAGSDFKEWVDDMRTLTPSHIVFNGKVGALTGENALKAKVGDNVLFIHMQANRDSRPHLIGGHGDYVWETGAFSSPPLENQETWFIRGGSVGAAIYKFKQPGTYVYLNHNLIEAVLFGAAAHVQVEGIWDNKQTKLIYKGSLTK